MFTLDFPHSYSTMNHPAAVEAEIESLTDSIAQSLFSVCVTLGRRPPRLWLRMAQSVLCQCVGNVPIIRCPRHGAAEMIARKLEARLREHVTSSKHNLFTEQGSRPGSQRTGEDAPTTLAVVGGV